jgi:hypothetical protein
VEVELSAISDDLEGPMRARGSWSCLGREVATQLRLVEESLVKGRPVLSYEMMRLSELNQVGRRQVEVEMKIR